MAAATSDPAGVPATVSPEHQALSLWTFVHTRARRFTTDDALTVVRALAAAPQEDPKALAKRLRTALEEHGVALKHTHALDAAARLLGHKGWHASDRQAGRKPLQFKFCRPSENRPLSDWSEGVSLFSDFCEGDLSAGGICTYVVTFTSTSVQLGTPMTTTVDKDGLPVPTMEVCWQPDDPKGLEGAIAAMETLRRRYEETGKGLVDGVAAAQFVFKASRAVRATLGAQQADEVANAELVVLDASSGPSSGEELARGTEVKCWYELQRLFPNHRQTACMDGADWSFDNQPFRWELSTMRLGKLAPEVLTRPLTVEESTRLFRRYDTAVRFDHSFIADYNVRRIGFSTAEAGLFEVDWDRFHAELVRVRGWETLDDEMRRKGHRSSLYNQEQFFKLAALLDLSQPAVLLKQPNRPSLLRLERNAQLRAFLCRVDDVLCEVPRRMPDSVHAAVNDAVDKLLLALSSEVRSASGVLIRSQHRLDEHLTYANQGDKFLSTLASLGLEAFYGVIPLVNRMKPGDRERFSEAPYTVGYALFLDIDYEG